MKLSHCCSQRGRVRPNQRDRLIALLRNRAPGWVSVPDVMAAAGAQYSARICELRQMGHRIESKPGGGWFRLVVHPAADICPALSLTTSSPAPQTDRLFPDDAPLRHLDLG